MVSTIDYLEKLMQDQEWNKALTYAEELLRQEQLTEVQMAIIYWALCNLRYIVADYAGSALAGGVAVVQTERLGLWDYHGKTCFDLSATYYRMGNYPEAETAIYNYLANRHHYSVSVARLEAKAWFNAGVLHSTMARHEEAAKEFASALAAATRLHMHRYAHGIRQALIEVYLRLNSLEPIPRLIAQCGHYLRTTTSIDQQQQTVFSHYQLRIDYAILTNRTRRARTLALRALAMSEGQPRYQYDFHIRLARIARQLGSNMEALGHAAAARILAANCHRFDLESEAAAFMYDVTSFDPQSLERMDEFYLR